MNANLKAETSIKINSGAHQVWDALTSPDKISKYLYGTRVHTTWKEGDPINFEGEYQGKKYHDKGVIKKFQPDKALSYTYWSSMGGKEDKPENYNLVSFELRGHNGETELKLSQDNIASEKEKEHSLQNWKGVLTKLKEVAEKS